MPRRPDIPDLFGLAPSPAEVAYDPAEVRAASSAGRLCRALSVTLREDGRSRDEIAGAMSVYLGREIGKDVLDRYAAPASDGHVINALRLEALAQVTGDARLLSLGLREMGFAVIERRHLPYVEIGILEERKAELARRQAELRRSVRRGG